MEPRVEPLDLHPPRSAASIAVDPIHPMLVRTRCLLTIAARKRTGVSDTIKAELEGEALYNDGIGIVICTLPAGVAVGRTTITPERLLHDPAVEAGGGLVLGYAVYRALHTRFSEHVAKVDEVARKSGTPVTV